jgi:hypothetical protein
MNKQAALIADCLMAERVAIAEVLMRTGGHWIPWSEVEPKGPEAEAKYALECKTANKREFAAFYEIMKNLLETPIQQQIEQEWKTEERWRWMLKANYDFEN